MAGVGGVVPGGVRAAAVGRVTGNLDSMRTTAGGGSAPSVGGDLYQKGLRPRHADLGRGRGVWRANGRRPKGHLSWGVARHPSFPEYGSPGRGGRFERGERNV